MSDVRSRLESYQPLWTNWYIDSYISRGASSEVFRFKQRGFDISCAVKVISVHMQNENGMNREQKLRSIAEKRIRAEREIGIMYQLNDSPYIVHCKNHDIKDTVNESGELIGFDILIQMNIYTCLEKHISDNDITLSEQEIIKLARNIGGALSDAHELGIIHRDIKPENIFLDKHNNYLLGDFGVSKQMQTNNYSTVAGTQPYIAPEIFRAGIRGKYNMTADIYSLGLVLYTLLNNNYYPFVTEHSNINDIDNAISDRLSGKPLPEPANGSAGLKRIIMKCCEFSPSDRYQKVEEMLDDLNKLNERNTVATASAPANDAAPAPKAPPVPSTPPAPSKDQAWLDYLNAHKVTQRPRPSADQHASSADYPTVFVADDEPTMLLKHNEDQTVYAERTFETPSRAPEPLSAPIIQNQNIADEEEDDEYDDRPHSNATMIILIIITAVLLLAATIYVLKSKPDDTGSTVSDPSSNSSIIVTKATSAPKTPSTDQTYKFMMPDLTGHSLDEIIEKYDGILEFDIHYARHTQHPDGIIFYQEPKADTIVTEGDVISISVSGVAVEDNETSDQSWWITSETANIVLPAFVSRKYTYVYQQYSDMFAFMPVYEFSDEYEPDTIMTQDIPASTLVERGTIIKLTISLGPKPH
ncbi:MAG: serine/threonine protein kinase [Ruminococcaceae bacterium]|nr:serine/threonine protein kinase [Oscillospiraceae bacterium]